MTMTIYLLAYLGALALALMITPPVILLARRFDIVDVPGPRHMHTCPVSHVGGVAIFLSVISTTVVLLWFTHIPGAETPANLPELGVLLVTAGFVFAIGLIDDIRNKGLRARTKFFAQIGAASVVCAAGIRIETLPLTDSMTLELGRLSWPFTLLWIVGITNAVNLSDGLDGLAAGVAAIASVVMAVLAASAGYGALVILLLALCGGVSGFLFFNFNPAKIFMGDCGSMFLGFTLASASVLCSVKSSTLTGLALPVLALGIPILDTFFSILRRFLERRSIFSADRGHFHHQLIDAGLTQRQAVLTIYGITLSAAGPGMAMMVLTPGYALILWSCLLLMFLLVFHVVGTARLHSIRKALEKRYRIIQQEHDERKRFEEADLYFRRAGTFDQWWQAVSTAAEKMDFWKVDLPLVKRDGTSRVLVWRHNGDSHEAGPEGLLEVRVPVHDRRGGSSLRLRIELHKNGSLESAGRKVALFTRLMEEYDMTTLRMDRHRLERIGGERLPLYL